MIAWIGSSQLSQQMTLDAPGLQELPGQAAPRYRPWPRDGEDSFSPRH